MSDPSRRTTFSSHFDRVQCHMSCRNQNDWLDNDIGKNERHPGATGKTSKMTTTRSQTSPFHFRKLTKKLFGTVNFGSLFKMKMGKTKTVMTRVGHFLSHSYCRNGKAQNGKRLGSALEKITLNHLWIPACM